MAYDAPKPICFMVMPFGIKETHTPGAPAKVNFDRLWEKVFKPLIETLGYEPVRADVDLGASIIRDMIERLALSDLVLADVTIANANVFYEVGIRHAACEFGCVLVAASWAKSPFDTQSMRREPFELADTDVTDEEAKSNVEKLVPRVRELATSKTPCYEMEGFPKLPLARAQAFRDWLREMNTFNAAVTALRLEPDAEARRQRAQEMVTKLTAAGAQFPLTVAYELVKVVRDLVGWKESGESDERCGLIGGRYKKLWRGIRDKDPDLAAEYLDRAIEYYEVGRRCDLNTYYSASNLPLLLRFRGKPRDGERAARIAVCVVAACERAIDLKIADEWVYPTLLVAAFNTGEVEKAGELLPKVRQNAVLWKLNTALDDLKDAVRLQEAIRAPLEEMVAVLDAVAAKLAKQ